jgi:Ca2+-binding RTX toxin-like protein
VTIDLSILLKPVAGLGGYAQGDVISSVENVVGSKFADKLTGDGGSNVLSGGPDKDTLTGGGGADTFYFANAKEGIDTITDYSGDKIGLSQDSFSLTSLQDGVNFIAENAPLSRGAESTILYDTKTGALYWDPDGTGSQAPVEFAILTGHPHLAAGDFLLMA